VQSQQNGAVKGNTTVRPPSQNTPNPITMVVMPQPATQLMTPTFAFPLAYPNTQVPNTTNRIIPNQQNGSLRVIVPTTSAQQPAQQITFHTKPTGKLLEKKNAVMGSAGATTISLHSSPAGSSVLSVPSNANRAPQNARVKLEGSITGLPGVINLEKTPTNGNHRRDTLQSDQPSKNLERLELQNRKFYRKS
jgi:hypothetical protein